MEPIFENITTPTEKMYISLFRVVHKKNRRKNVILWCVAMVCAWYVIWHLGLPYRWSLVLLEPFYLYLIIKELTSHRETGKRVYLRDFAYNDNSIPPKTFRFYPEYMESRDVDSWHITPYAKLLRVEFLEDIIILARKDEQAFILDPRAFTKGDYQSFIRFLREQTPHLNPAEK